MSESIGLASAADGAQAAAVGHPRRNKRLWALDVNIPVDMFEARLAANKAATRWTAGQVALEAGILKLLASARAATLRKEPVPGRLSNWWRGTLIETAYENLHAAESLMV